MNELSCTKWRLQLYISVLCSRTKLKTKQLVNFILFPHSQWIEQYVRFLVSVMNSNSICRYMCAVL
jgi:hypothetical protein